MSNNVKLSTEELLARATARPWNFEESDWSVRAKAFGKSDMMGDYRGNTIAGMESAVGHGPEGKSRRFAIPEMEANAELLVRAVNSFEAMRGALEEMIVEAREHNRMAVPVFRLTTLERALAALVLANGVGVDNDRKTNTEGKRLTYKTPSQGKKP